MPLAESFREHAEYLADLTYEPHGVGYRFKVVPTNPPLTERRGVYFLLSHSHTKVQKVGLANGMGGLSQRMLGYTRLYVGDGETGDRTMALWYRQMTGPLQGQTLSLWFVSMSESRTSKVLGEDWTLSWDPHPDLERVLIQKAMACSEPLLLTQTPAPEPRPIIRPEAELAPEWLLQPPTTFSKLVGEQFLGSCVVYYPGSGEDFAPMQLFAGAAHCYLYADYSTELAGPPSIPGCTVVHSQELTADEVLQGLGLDGAGVPPFEYLTEREREQLVHLVPGPRIASGRWSILEQAAKLEGVPARRRIALLQVKGEAVSLYRAIWGIRNPRPSLFALYTAHDGPNWTDWSTEGALFWVAVNHNAFPLWYRCCNGREWPEYDAQFQDQEGSGVLRRTEDPQRLRPMELFRQARDVLGHGLPFDKEAGIAISKFWRSRYASFLDAEWPGNEDVLAEDFDWINTPTWRWR